MSEDFPPGMADAAQVSLVKKCPTKGKMDRVLARYEGLVSGGSQASESL